MPRGEHLKGKRSMNPAARSIVPQGVHDGRFLTDRRRTRKYHTNVGAAEGFPEIRQRRKDELTCGEFEDYICHKMDHEDLRYTTQDGRQVWGAAARIRAKDDRRGYLNRLAKQFWERVEAATAASHTCKIHTIGAGSDLVSAAGRSVA